MQLAQFDAKRGALDYTRMSKIRDVVDEFASDLSDQLDYEPDVTAHTKDSEAAAAVESISDIAVANLPALQKQDLEPEWRGECPVLCVAARTPLDEAAARLFGQLANAHGLAARIKPAEALSTANIFRLETTGVALVCLSYLDVSSPAHMRYAVQRLRRKLPNATIMVGCWAEDFRQRSAGSTAGGGKSRYSCRQSARSHSDLPRHGTTARNDLRAGNAFNNQGNTLSRRPWGTVAASRTMRKTSQQPALQ